MKNTEDFKYVYDNWYLVSCEMSNKEPVSFETYLKTIPTVMVNDIKSFLREGKAP